MTDSTQGMARAVFFVAVLCLSVVVMGMGFTGSVSAEETVDSDNTIGTSRTLLRELC